MYDLCVQLTEASLDELRAPLAALDLKPGPGGSFATEPTRTSALYAKFFDFPIVARVFGLLPSAQIVGHCDPPVAGTRYHCPLKTNDGCWVFHGEDWKQLVAGYWYAMDPTVFHGAVNWGATTRLHLVVDC